MVSGQGIRDAFFFRDDPARRKLVHDQGTFSEMIVGGGRSKQRPYTTITEEVV